jgi:hypothetical protein
VKRAALMVVWRVDHLVLLVYLWVDEMVALMAVAKVG